MNAHTIAMAFNQQNDKKNWTARALDSATAQTVHFHSNTGLVSLSYDVPSRQFEVRFNKVHATWGDYVKAIARALVTVLSTLKSAGLPFEAPPSPAGIEIAVTASDDSTTYVRWVAPVLVENVTLAMLYPETIL